VRGEYFTWLHRKAAQTPGAYDTHTCPKNPRRNASTAQVSAKPRVLLNRGRMRERRNFSRPRQIEIGKTAAHCERCRCEHFVRLRTNMDAMRCLACGAQYTFTELLVQIAATADPRTQEIMSEAKVSQKRSQHPVEK
jgi:hypothetical protein